VQRILEVTPASAPSYPVLCGADASRALGGVWRGWRQAVIIGDEHTATLFAKPLARSLGALGAEVLELSMPAGEAHKTRRTKEALEDAMLAAGIDREACVVAVGGGVVLDVAGFVAATYLRGVAHVNVATSLLAMVDAAVGGKTAVSTPAGKNLVGAFHHPRAVLLDTAALATLPPSELRSGLAEAIKHAALWDEALFGRLEAWVASLPEDGAGRSLAPPPDEIVARAVQIKAEVVALDDRDRGPRHLLNFGHTVAHALEHATGHALAHGHAVAVGMVVEARALAGAGAFPAGDVDRLAALLERVGLPTAPPCGFEAALPFLHRDKKAARGQVRCAAPVRLGRAEPLGDAAGGWLHTVSEQALRAAFAACGGGGAS
jgi:3-dehydroquinate synthase